METISIKDNNFKVYEFEKPDFECELFTIKPNIIYGIWYDEKYDEWRNGQWGLNSGLSNDGAYSNLSPIKQKWYEDSNNFPALAVDKKTGAYYKVVCVEEGFIITDDGFRFKKEELILATKEERDSLYCER